MEPHNLSIRGAEQKNTKAMLSIALMVFIPVTRRVKEYTRFVEKYVTGGRNRLRPYKVHIRINNRVDLPMFVHIFEKFLDIYSIYIYLFINIYLFKIFIYLYIYIYFFTILLVVLSST